MSADSCMKVDETIEPCAFSEGLLVECDPSEAQFIYEEESGNWYKVDKNGGEEIDPDDDTLSLVFYCESETEEDVIHVIVDDTPVVEVEPEGEGPFLWFIVEE